jgi:hypothetical protein
MTGTRADKSYDQHVISIAIECAAQAQVLPPPKSNRPASWVLPLTPFLRTASSPLLDDHIRCTRACAARGLNEYEDVPS